MSIEQRSESQPRCGALAPDFSLPDVMRAPDTEPVRLRAWRQRSAVLLALLPSTMSELERVAWLHALTARRDDLADANVVTLALLAGSREDAQALLRGIDFPWPLLADPDGATVAKYLGQDAIAPALAVMDRYSILLALLPPLPSNEPDLDTALREFAFAEQDDCACGLPAWEAQ